jgi:hypothetical protein
MISLTYKFLKPVALFLAETILFQGCQIYYKQTATPEQAFESNAKVKIITIDDRIMLFEKIKVEDNVLYGIQKIKNKSINLILPKSDIKEIHLINEKASITSSIILICCIVSGGVVLLGFSFADSMKNTEWVSFND